MEKWFRLRLSEKGNSLNFKHWYFDSKGKTLNHCDEYEFKITESDTAKKMLEALEFQEIITIVKKRTIWVYNRIEISIDEVMDLGTFVELEAKEIDSSIEMTLSKLEDLADKLDLVEDDSIKLGYPMALINKTHA